MEDFRRRRKTVVKEIDRVKVYPKLSIENGSPTQVPGMQIDQNIFQLNRPKLSIVSGFPMKKKNG
jgi:hypothetical protein